MPQVARYTLFYLAFLALPLVTAAIMFQPYRSQMKFSDYMNVKYEPRIWANRLNSYLQIRVLGHTNAGNIHLGQKPWVFYMTQTDGTALDDFFGRSTNVAEKWVNYMRPTLTKPFGFNVPYMFVMVPNKETVYPEKTNYLFIDDIAKERGNYSSVLKAIQPLSPNAILSLYGPLNQGKSRLPTYYSADSHWNDWGMYIALGEIFKAVRAVAAIEVEPQPIKSAEIGGPAHDDIFKMFGGVDRAINYNFDPGVGVTLEYSAPIDPASKKVWLIGDSFAEELTPMLRPYFKNLVTIHFLLADQEIPRELAASGPPDLIIEERVERYLAFAPTYADYTSAKPVAAHK